MIDKKSIEPETMEDMYDCSVCSATECTGLIPSLPLTDDELTSYEEIYRFVPQAKHVHSDDYS